MGVEIFECYKNNYETIFVASKRAYGHSGLGKYKKVKFCLENNNGPVLFVTQIRN